MTFKLIRLTDARDVPVTVIGGNARNLTTLALLHETLAEYQYRGMRGYGIAEYLLR